MTPKFKKCSSELLHPLTSLLICVVIFKNNVVMMSRCHRESNDSWDKILDI